MIVAYAPFVVLLVGGVAYKLVNDAKLGWLALVTYGVGLFWTVYSLLGHTARL